MYVVLVIKIIFQKIIEHIYEAGQVNSEVSFVSYHPPEALKSINKAFEKALNILHYYSSSESI